MAYNKNCDPLKYQYDVPILPPIPGLDGFTADLNFPTFGIELPDGIPEDLLDWIRRLRFNLPGGGILEGILRSLQDTIAEIIARLLQSLNLFLSMYNFIMSIIEIIICIINVLTAFKSIRKMIKRIKCLIRKCFPLFVRVVMPFFALLALLLNLLALLLALIEYIIDLIRRLIEQLLRNIKRLKNVLRDGNSNSALAIIAKLSDLMCLFEHVFVLLSIIELIFALIEGKLNKNFKVCNGGSSSGSILTDDDLCASFLQEPNLQISESPEIWNLRMKGGSNAFVWYCNEVYGQPFSLFPATSVAKIRNESVYLQDDSLADALKFKNVIKYKPINENRYFPMFPFDKTITEDMDESLIPYFVDITINADPNDGYGARDITVENTVVTLPTFRALLDVIANIPKYTTNNNGYLSISGGQTIDDFNGYNGKTIKELLKDVTGYDPNISGNGSQSQLALKSYQVKANYEALVEYGLVTIGCLPTMKQEYAHFDEVYEKPLRPNISVDLPDMTSAIANMRQCVNTLNSSFNETAINTFDNCMNEILVDLSNQANTAYCQLLDQSIDIYNTQINLTPEMQFVTLPIEVKVKPISDDNRTFDELVGGFGSSIDINSCISTKFTAKVTLGDISTFTYDGYGNFIAEITSDTPGDGYVDVYYNGEQIPTVIAPNNIDQQPSVTYESKEYTFVGFFDDGYAEGVLPLPRRDFGDISRD
jgi:hypothetical protein